MTRATLKVLIPGLIPLLSFLAPVAAAQFSCSGEACSAITLGGHFATPFQFADFRNSSSRQVKVSFQLSALGVGSSCSGMEMVVQAHNVSSTTGAFCGSGYTATWASPDPNQPHPPLSHPTPPPVSGGTSQPSQPMLVTPIQVRAFSDHPTGCPMIKYELRQDDPDNFPEFWPPADPNLHPPVNQAREVYVTQDGTWFAEEEDWRDLRCIHGTLLPSCLTGVYMDTIDHSVRVTLQQSGDDLNVIVGAGTLLGTVKRTDATSDVWKGAAAGGEINVHTFTCNDVILRVSNVARSYALIK